MATSVTCGECRGMCLLIFRIGGRWLRLCCLPSRSKSIQDIARQNRKADTNKHKLQVSKSRSNMHRRNLRSTEHLLPKQDCIQSKRGRTRCAVRTKYHREWSAHEYVHGKKHSRETLHSTMDKEGAATTRCMIYRYI